MEKLKKVFADSTPLVIFAGFFGAIGPNLSGFVASAQSSSFEAPHLAYWIGTFILGLIGATFVLISKEKIAWKALLQGLGSPTFFSSTGNVAVAVVSLMGPMEPQTVYADTTTVDSSTMIKITSKEPVEVVIDNVRHEVQGTVYITTKNKSDIIVRNKDLSTKYKPDYEYDSINLIVKINKQKAKRGWVQSIFPMQQQTVEKLAPETIDVEVE